MIGLLKDALSSPAGSFAFVFALMILGGWLIHWVTKKVTEINAEHSGFSKTVDKMETTINDIRKDLSYVKGSIDVIKAGNTGALLRSKSPISLTDEGNAVSKEIGAEAIIARNWDGIFSILEKFVGNTNAYDIQQYCMENVSVDPERFFDAEGLTVLKNYAYNQGNPLQLYTRMMGVLIRDKYMKIKGIAMAEIDKHDPNTNESTSAGK